MAVIPNYFLTYLKVNFDKIGMNLEMLPFEKYTEKSFSNSKQNSLIQQNLIKNYKNFPARRNPHLNFYCTSRRAQKEKIR
jgi:hypothetical protein